MVWKTSRWLQEIACPTSADCDPLKIIESWETDMIDSATGCEVYRGINECGDAVLYYNNPDNGEIVLTNSGFTKAAGSVTTQEAYETLASGAVERLNQTVMVDAAGAITGTTYSQFGDGSAYTPADLAMVAPEPQKLQMGEESFDVTGASTSLPNIPTVANSQGQNFPQHAYVHVEADSDNTAAGISYTTDGTDPAESATAKEFEVSEGKGFDLDTWEEIDGFRAVPIDGNGDPDAALTVQVSVEYNNISPDKGDV